MSVDFYLRKETETKFRISDITKIQRIISSCIRYKYVLKTDSKKPKSVILEAKDGRSGVALEALLGFALDQPEDMEIFHNDCKYLLKDLEASRENTPEVTVFKMLLKEADEKGVGLLLWDDSSGCVIPIFHEDLGIGMGYSDMFRIRKYFASLLNNKDINVFLKSIEAGNKRVAEATKNFIRTKYKVGTIERELFNFIAQADCNGRLTPASCKVLYEFLNQFAEQNKKQIWIDRVFDTEENAQELVDAMKRSAESDIPLTWS